MYADGRVEVRVGRCHDRRHRPARRQARHENATRIDVVFGHYLAGDAGNERGLPLVPLLVCCLEPVPALGWVGTRSFAG